MSCCADQNCECQYNGQHDLLRHQKTERYGYDKKAGPFLIEDSEMENRRVGEGEQHSWLQRTCNNG